MAAVRFLPCGDCALVAELGSEIDPAIHDQVLDLDARLARFPIEGVTETVPTYRSIMVHFDPLLIKMSDLKARIEALMPSDRQRHRARKSWTIPVCYEPPYGEDLTYVAEKLGLSPDKVRTLHSSATYRIYMYGFAPGLTYLGGLPRELTLSRRSEPRPRVDRNKVMIAGGQAIITTVPMPNAWHILGETPESVFNPDRQPQFLFDVGDALTFEAVTAEAFATLKGRAANGEVVARRTNLM